MGTHISRVKSVDLDSWTDEQLQSMLKWGNARANKYNAVSLSMCEPPADVLLGIGRRNWHKDMFQQKRECCRLLLGELQAHT